MLAKHHLHLARMRKKHKGVSHKGEKLQTAAPRSPPSPSVQNLDVVPSAKYLGEYSMKVHLVAT